MSAWRWARLYLLFEVLGISYAKALDAEKPPLRHYERRVWQSESGLPQNSVYSLLQTADGYLWAGTAEGLARFDGARFTVFDRSNTPAIANNVILSLFEARDGTLWAGTYGGGVIRYRDRRFRAYTKAEGLSDNAVNAIAQDQSGDMWFGTEGGLNRLRDDRFRAYSRNDGLGSEVVNAILSDQENNLWVGTSAGLHRLRGEKFELFSEDPALKSAAVQSLLQDRAGNIWVGTSEALYVIPPAGGTARRNGGLPKKPIGSLYEDPTGSLWAATRGGGICRVNGAQVDCLTEKEGLSSSSAWSVTGDREGNLWVGTEGGGLNQLRDGKFTVYRTPEGLSSDLVGAVFEDRAGALWVGTYGGGLNWLENGRFTTFGASDGLSGDTVLSLCQTRDGTLWIGTSGAGLSRWNEGRLTPYSGKDVHSKSIVAALYEDRAGNLWAGTSEGLFCLTGPSPVRRTTAEGLSHNNVTFLRESRDGSLWIGTWDGLNRLRGNVLKAYTTKDGLSHSTITWIHEDERGTLWIGTYGGGLNRFRDNRFTRYTKREGLFDDVVYQILDDGLGNFWMSSNKGIFRTEKSQLEAFAAGRIPKISCVAYDRSDGLPTVEFNGVTQNAGLKTRDGRLFFSSIRGLVSIHPRRIRTNHQPPPVYIEEVIGDGQALPAGFSADDAGQSPKERLEFRYTAVSFSAPEKVSFRYKLEGFDRGWIEAGARRTAYYTNMGPGRYRFRVIASNNDGLWNEDGATFSFSLKPRFHQTVWFYLLWAVAAAAAAGGGYRLRVRGLQRRRKTLARLVLARTKQLAEANQRLGQSLQAEERAHALERQLASVVRHAREAIVTWGSDGRIESWNPAAEGLYGMSAEQAIGRHIETIVPESGRPLLRAGQERLLAGEKVPIAEVYRLRDGAEIQVEESLFLLPEAPDRPRRIASVARDLSEISRLRRATEILSGSDRFQEERRRNYRSSRAMQEVLEAADIAAQDRNATVLLLGETGSGKEWLARRMHANSPRATKPFFVVNCASLGPALLESELFGHERGAFTGATSLKHGLVEVAEGGSLFLDEIGELSAGVQAQLLTFLDNRTFRRVGGTRNLTADVRILAATNADLKQAVEKSVFRKDLYFRLSVIPIHVPPLRERREEIPALANAIAQEIAKRAGRPEVPLDRSVTSAFQRYEWPGNVRELSNALERASILSRGQPIELRYLPPEIRESHPRTYGAPQELEDVERSYILQVLEQVQGNRTRAAKILGISRSTLKRKLYGPGA